MPSHFRKHSMPFSCMTRYSILKAIYLFCRSPAERKRISRNKTKNSKPSTHPLSPLPWNSKIILKTYSILLSGPHKLFHTQEIFFYSPCFALLFTADPIWSCLASFFFLFLLPLPLPLPSLLTIISFYLKFSTDKKIFSFSSFLPFIGLKLGNFVMEMKEWKSNYKLESEVYQGKTKIKKPVKNYIPLIYYVFDRIFLMFLFIYFMRIRTAHKHALNSTSYIVYITSLTSLQLAVLLPVTSIKYEPLQ